jgi:hypothetical protein
VPWAFLLACFLAAGTGAHAQDYRLQAQVEPESAQVGETLVYVLNVEYQQKAPPDPVLPKLDPGWGLGDMRLAGRMQQTQIVNGAVSQSNIYRFTFTASKSGTFAIPPSSISADGMKYESNPVTLRVGKVAASATLGLPTELQGRIAAPIVPRNPSLQQALTGVVFVLPVVETTTPYDGQHVLLSYHLCIDQEALARAGLSGGSLAIDQVDIPQFKQFLKDELFPFPRNLQFREQQIGQKKFAVAPLYQVAVSSTKTGKLEAEPFRVGLWLGTKSGGRSSVRDPLLDSFFSDDPFFGGMSPFMSSNRVQVVAMSPTVEFDVRPVPSEGKPAGYSGAVGEFGIIASLDKQQATANEDVLRLQIKVEGKGDASAIAPPQLPDMDGINLLEEPKSKVERRIEDNHLVSTKTFDYIIRPVKPGRLTVPPVSLSAFNPQTKQYTELKTDPLELAVAPGSNQPLLVAPTGPSTTGSKAQSGRSGEAPPEIRSDIRYIHEGTLDGLEPGILTGEGFLFAALLAFPPLLLAAAYLAGRRRLAIESDRAGYRQLIARDVARKHLRKAERLMHKGDQQLFFSELARALRGYFADKFRQDPMGITLEQISREMAVRGADGDLAGRTAALLEECDAARFAPGAPVPGTLESALNSALELIDAMERIR